MRSRPFRKVCVSFILFFLDLMELASAMQQPSTAAQILANSTVGVLLPSLILALNRADLTHDRAISSHLLLKTPLVPLLKVLSPSCGSCLRSLALIE